MVTFSNRNSIYVVPFLISLMQLGNSYENIPVWVSMLHELYHHHYGSYLHGQCHCYHHGYHHYDHQLFICFFTYLFCVLVSSSPAWASNATSSTRNKANNPLLASHILSVTATTPDYAGLVWKKESHSDFWHIFAMNNIVQKKQSKSTNLHCA